MNKDSNMVRYEVTISQDTIEKYGSFDTKATIIFGEAIKRGVSILEAPEKTA